jgi:trk system potassium uptake protein TrkH
MVLLLGVFMGVSVALSAVVPAGKSHDTGLDLGGWAISLGMALVAGSAMLASSNAIAKRSDRQPAMRRREAMALVGAGWFVCSCAAALPYYFCAPHVSPDFAFFEGASGLTTTGATIFVDIEALPKSILMWRSFTQWFGGMGILAMFVVILSGMTSSSKTLIGAESSLSHTDIESLQQTMRRLWVLYLGFTILCGLGLWLMGLTPFQAVNHALTAISTGGFGTENASTAGEPFGSGSKIWLAIFMLLGATSFPFYLTILKRKWVDLRDKFEEVYWFLGMVVFASTVLVVQHWTGSFDGVDPVDIVFNVISVVTSTGFVSSDYGDWSRLGIGVLILLMMVGGCSGSTAGGLKMGRIILWLRFLKAGLHRTFRPKMVDPIKLNGRGVPESSVEQLFLVLSLFGFFAIMGTFALQILEPQQSLMGSITAVVSCLGNIGPAMADMGGGESFAEVGTVSKLLFSVLMILGRLEYVAVLVLFSRQLWKRY